MAKSQEVLVVGGYGRAGTEIARLLVNYSKYSITIAGRRKYKATNTAIALNDQATTERCKNMKLDITDILSLKNVLPGYDLMINCVPIPINYDSVIQAVVNAGIDYIDLIPSKNKSVEFKKYASRIAQNNSHCILEAGWEPGLPAFLTRFGAQKLNDHAKDIEIHAVYREKEMPHTSIADIIHHANLKASFFENGNWLQKSILNNREMQFPKTFGKVTGYPTELAELKTVVDDLVIRSLKFYQGGYNPVCDLILFIWTFLGLRKNKYFKKVGINLFQWGNKWFSKPPFGGVIKVKLENKSQSLQIIALTEDLYRATAIPVVATTKQILEDIINDSGVHYMGSIVKPEPFEQEITTMGISIEVQRNNRAKT